MRPQYRIRDSSAVRLGVRYGRKIVTPLFVLHVRPNSAGVFRCAFVVSRAVAKRAVERNLLKRRAREWFRVRRARFQPVDVVMVFKKEACRAARREFYETLSKNIGTITRHR